MGRMDPTSGTVLSVWFNRCMLWVPLLATTHLKVVDLYAVQARRQLN
jgi:hypothetical protein